MVWLSSWYGAPSRECAGIFCKASAVGQQKMHWGLSGKRIDAVPLGLPVQGHLVACGCSYSGEMPCGT